MKIKIELLEKPLDAETLQRLNYLNKKYGTDPSFDFTSPHVHYIFVAIVNKTIIGYGLLNRPHGHWFLRNCVVDKKYRGGVQKRLIKDRLIHAVQLGATKVSVGVFQNNHRSLNNLIESGFRHSGIVKDKKLGTYQKLVFNVTKEIEEKWM